MAILAIIFYMILFLLPQWMQDRGAKAEYFKVVSAKSYLVDYDYYIDASLKMDFSPAVIEALENGVSLTLKIELRLEEINSWFDTILKRSSLQFELRYHALTEIYSIKNLLTEQEYSFNSRKKAMELLGTITHAHLIEKQKLDSSKEHTLYLRVLLDIWKLPDVLLPVASLSDEWNLTSQWYTWSLD